MDPDPVGPKTHGSGSTTLLLIYCAEFKQSQVGPIVAGSNRANRGFLEQGQDSWSRASVEGPFVWGIMPTTYHSKGKAKGTKDFSNL
jgi:hypothetical protein